MIKQSLKYFMGIAMLIIVFVLTENTAYAGEFDNAYNFYTKHVNDDSPAYLNKNDGYVYFCSWGTKSSTSTKYKTVGYTLTINYNGKKDHIEVKLGGSIVRNVSTVTKNNVVYVLRRAKLSRLQELFSGNSEISWHQIFRKKNTYEFDAIMTVSEKGEDLCGNITETSGERRITSDNPGYLFRTAAGIKSACNWKNPADLNNFFGRSVVLEPVSPINVGNIQISGDHIYNHNNNWYVKKNSTVCLGFTSSFNDVEAVTARYHPNYNVYKFTGWGDNQKYYVSQGTGGSSKGKSGVLIAGTSANKPVSKQGINYSGTTTFKQDSMNFTGSLIFTMLAPDGKNVQAVPEGRVYYNNVFPEKDSDEDYLCDLQSNTTGKISMISDGTAPQITAPTYISAFMNAETPVSIQVSDSGAGISLIRVYRNDGAVVYNKWVNGYYNYLDVSTEVIIPANDMYSYYVYAVDNVGNESTSGYFRFSTPKAYTIQANTSGGVGYYNGSIIHANVFGGNTEISSIVIMSEDYDNPSGERIVATNMSVEAHTLEAGKRQLYHVVDVMDYIRNYPDGRYMFDVISGGRYVASTPARVAVIKDLTPPKITRVSSNVPVSGWYKQYYNHTVYVDDALAGVKDISVNCNGLGMEFVREYDEASHREKVKFRIDTEGINKVEVWANDNAGNEKLMKIETKIDATPPDYSMYGGLVGTDTNYSKWINRQQLYGGITVADRLSGVNLLKSNGVLKLYNSNSNNFVNLDEDYYDILQYDYEKATIKFSSSFIDNVTSSKNRFMLNVNDRAFNVLQKEFRINVDCDAPTLEYPDRDSWNPDTYKGNIVLKDVHSGIGYVEIKYKGEVKKRYAYEGTPEEKIYVDMSEYADEYESVYVVTSDMVGNTAEYELECNEENKTIRAIKSIRTRIR